MKPPDFFISSSMQFQCYSNPCPSHGRKSNEFNIMIRRLLTSTNPSVSFYATTTTVTAEQMAIARRIFEALAVGNKKSETHDAVFGVWELHFPRSSPTWNMPIWAESDQLKNTFRMGKMNLKSLINDLTLWKLSKHYLILLRYALLTTPKYRDSAIWFISVQIWLYRDCPDA